MQTPRSERQKPVEVFTLLDEVHYTARLIWSPTQKAEMLDALKSEIKDFEVVRELQPMAEWDFESFSVNYEVSSKRDTCRLDKFVTLCPFCAESSWAVAGGRVLLATSVGGVCRARKSRAAGKIGSS